MQNVLKILGCPLIYYEHRLPFALFTLLIIGKFALFYFYVIFVGEPFERLRICHLLVFHYETHGISALSTAETMTCTARRRYDERRCFLVMKGAQAHVIGATLTERHEFGYHIYDIGGIFNLFNGWFVYHRFL